jgi:hypothetical protein
MILSIGQARLQQNWLPFSLPARKTKAKAKQNYA